MLVLAHLEDPSRKTCPVCVSMLVLAHLEDPSRKTCPVCVSMLVLAHLEDLYVFHQVKHVLYVFLC